MVARLNHRIYAAEVRQVSAVFLCVLVIKYVSGKEEETKTMSATGYMRVNSVKQLEGKPASPKEKSMMEKILGSERVGYAQEIDK